MTEAVTESFDLRQVLSVVRTYLVSIVAIIAAALVFGIVFTMLQTPLYSASSSVQIDDAAAQILPTDTKDQSVSGGWDVERFLNTQLDIVKSRALAARVAERLKLYGNAQFLAAMGADPAAGGDRKRMENRTINLLRANMNVTLPRQSRIANITFVSADPQLSAQIANTYADEFIRANLQRKFDSSEYARTFVQDQLAAAKVRLEESEQALNNYARSAGIIRPREAGSSDSGAAGGASVTTASLMQLNQAANEARAARIAAEGRWNAISSGPALSSQAVLSNNTVQSLLTKRAEVEAQLREDQVRRLDDYPTVQRLKAQLSTLDKELDSVVSGVRASVRQEYQAALAVEQSLNAQVASLKTETLGEQDRGVRYTILAREADTNRTLYDGLLQRYKELNAAAGISASNIALIDRANPPTGPSSPNLFVNIAYALFAGLLLAGLQVFVRIQLDDAVRVPEDVEAKLSLSVLGIIPSVKADDPKAELDDPKSPLSESYNSLRGALSFATTEGAPQSLLVTSASASEGKSTTSFALACGFAKLGLRVVLVDVDLRRPSTHKQFGLTNEAGLSSLLVGQSTLRDSIHASGIANLDVLTAGPIPPSPTELLASPRMRAVVADLCATYDMVILDSPPILGLADAPLLSSLAAGTLLVIESDRNRRGILKGILRRMRIANARILGVVLTKFDARNASSYTYYYGYDYYSYEGARRQTGVRGFLGRKRAAEAPADEVTA